MKNMSFWMGISIILSMATTSWAHEKGKEAVKGDLREELPVSAMSSSLVRSGFTRPGTPSDKIGKNGEILQAALDPDHTGLMIGSTVYFAVYKNASTDYEGFGPELTALTNFFVAGRSFENSISPNLDRKAKYLYLYQIVNDRGLNPTKEGTLPALDKDINTANISHFALRLLVDPRYLTSWGHFNNFTFDAKVADSKVGKGAADELVRLPMSFSSNPAIVKELPFLRFQERSPAFGLGNLLNNFGLNKSNLNLQNSSAYANLLKLKAEGKSFNWVANELEASVNGGHEPDFVQVIYNNFKEDEAPILTDHSIGDTLFRVDFKLANAVRVGQHSVVFGFTSDLPPTDEPIRVEGPMPVLAGAKAKDGKGIAPNVAPGVAPGGPGLNPAPASAIGTAPTPIGVAEPVSSPMVSSYIGGTAVGGFGGGGFGGFGFPRFGFGGWTPVAAAVGGGSGGGTGSGGGNGSGQGNNQGQQTQSQAQNQQQAPLNINNTINFNALLINQQAQFQAQLQAQFQAQMQNNNCGHHHDGHVVPEPSAIIMGFLGLPALFLFRRLRKQTPRPINE